MAREERRERERAGEGAGEGQVGVAWRSYPPGGHGGVAQGEGTVAWQHSAATVATGKEFWRKPPALFSLFPDFLLLKAATKIHLIGVLKPLQKL